MSYAGINAFSQNLTINPTINIGKAPVSDDVRYMSFISSSQGAIQPLSRHGIKLSRGAMGNAIFFYSFLSGQRKKL